MRTWLVKTRCVDYLGRPSVGGWIGDARTETEAKAKALAVKGHYAVRSVVALSGRH
jgi:hypothetical protein